ncbi:hypothetical protein [Bathymodiolus platifrons methanotrophic gill symbiont]|nr:hypothetical protein [Bathymodiolus platifrons methanotrophic gill symbiont]
MLWLQGNLGSWILRLPGMYCTAHGAGAVYLGLPLKILETELKRSEDF